MQVDEIKGKIRAKGLTQAEFAKKLGMSEKTFYNKMKKGVFGSDDIEKMMEILGIDELVPIFFSK